MTQMSRGEEMRHRWTGIGLSDRFFLDISSWPLFSAMVTEKWTIPALRSDLIRILCSGGPR